MRQQHLYVEQRTNQKNVDLINQLSLGQPARPFECNKPTRCSGATYTQICLNLVDGEQRTRGERLDSFHSVRMKGQ